MMRISTNLVDTATPKNLDIVTNEAFTEDVLRCFLCNYNFLEGEEPWLMFDKFIQEDGLIPNSLSTILSDALQIPLLEGATHSNLLCDGCNAAVLEYDHLEKRFNQLRQNIVISYNETMRLNNLFVDRLNSEYVHEASEEGKTILETNDELIASNVEAFVVNLDASKMAPIVTTSSNKDELLVDEFFVTDDANNENFPQVQLHQEDAPENDFTCNADPNNLLDEHKVEPSDIIVIDDQAVQSYEDMYVCGNNQSVVDTDSNISDVLEVDQADDNSLLVAMNEGTTTSMGDSIDDSANESVENVYVCYSCNSPCEFSRESFVEHMDKVHSSTFYFCQMCKSGYGNRQRLKEHMLRDHGTDISMEYVCQTCNRCFDNQRQYRTHKRMHYNNIKNFECKECHKRYSSKYLLNEHMNMHTGDRPFKCDQCPKDFASKYTLQAHVKIHTERQRPFQCSQCDKCFLNQQNLSKHQQLHMGVKSYVCDICLKAFTTPHNLDVHQIVHTGERPFICRTCGKAFARRAEIKDHERIHTGERPFKCDICEMAFAQRSNLMSHKKSTHLNHKHHKCEHCERSFKRRRLLDYHVQSVHTGERPHKCKTCDAAFVYPEHYKKHMLIHSGKKPFACEICGKLFNSRDNRNAHRFVHSDKKPYECSHCGASYMRKPLLLSHMEQSGHYNDNIIVNQPVITKGSKELHFKTRFLESVESIDDDVLDSVSALEGMEEGNDQLIKTELDEEKYLDFEGLDEDATDTLGWVDISSVQD